MIKLNSFSIEVIANIFTVIDGKIKILLTKKTNEPYKGYWMLPSKMLNEGTIEDNINILLKEQIQTENIYLEQDYTFSSINRVPNDKVIAVSYICIVDGVTAQKINNNSELVWFSINEIPKMAFDHKEIIDKSINKLKIRLVNTNVLKCLFPSDFTLPELQCIYEFILDKKLDRRNFRKKFIGLDLIEDTGYKNDGKNGRPAKLYKFKDNLKNLDLFK
ncbi:MAG: NUDIX hydrolase [Bacilli bacterium]|nr:NUDIX hydrolase [Bacilli bacterium]